MTLHRGYSETRKPKRKTNNPRVFLRFSTAEQHKLVTQAAKNSALSMNAWLIKTIVPAARREVKLAEGEGG